MITLLKKEHVPSILAIIFHKSSMSRHRQVYCIFTLIINETSLGVCILLHWHTMSPTIRALQFLSVYHYPQVKIQLPHLRFKTHIPGWQWLTTCVVFSFSICQIQCKLKQWKTKLWQKTEETKQKNCNWLWNEQVSLTASKDRNFSSRIPNKLCSQPTLLFNGCQRIRFHMY